MFLGLAGPERAACELAGFFLHAGGCEPFKRAAFNSYFLIDEGETVPLVRGWGGEDSCGGF